MFLDRFISLNMNESLAVRSYLEYRNKFLAGLQQRTTRYIVEQKQQTRIRSEVVNCFNFYIKLFNF